MFRKFVRAGLCALVVLPSWTTIHPIDVPLPRIELVPCSATEPKPQPEQQKPAFPSDEATREKDVPHHRLPFQYDVMPAEEDRDEQAPRADVLDIRGA